MPSTCRAAGNLDTVTDFAAGDRVQVDGDVFGVKGGARRASARLNSKYFAEGSAKDGNDRLVYDKASGNLFADFNGDGAGGAVQIAHFNGSPDIGAKDILVA